MLMCGTPDTQGMFYRLPTAPFADGIWTRRPALPRLGG